MQIMSRFKLTNMSFHYALDAAFKTITYLDKVFYILVGHGIHHSRIQHIFILLTVSVKGPDIV